jgi:hypothetical protein
MSEVLILNPPKKPFDIYCTRCYTIALGLLSDPSPEILL